MDMTTHAEWETEDIWHITLLCQIDFSSFARSTDFNGTTIRRFKDQSRANITLEENHICNNFVSLNFDDLLLYFVMYMRTNVLMTFDIIVVFELDAKYRFRIMPNIDALNFW